MLFWGFGCLGLFAFRLLGLLLIWTLLYWFECAVCMFSFDCLVCLGFVTMTVYFELQFVFWLFVGVLFGFVICWLTLFVLFCLLVVCLDLAWLTLLLCLVYCFWCFGLLVICVVGSFDCI